MTLTLYSDATPERFAIVSELGRPVWYGTFDELDEVATAPDAELSAARKAVYVAAMARATELVLRTDAQWLTWANSQDGRGGRALGLAKYAQRLGVRLTVEWVRGTSNPADYYTRRVSDSLPLTHETLITLRALVRGSSS